MDNPNEVIMHPRTRLWKYYHYAGPVRSRFLVELRDNKRITGTRCSICNRVFVPARPTCFVCLNPMDEWTVVSDQGTLMTYTVVYQAEPSYPFETPFIYGIIKLDGADTGIAHIIDEVSPGNLKIGMRVQAVFRDERVGSILDIKYFRPI